MPINQTGAVNDSNYNGPKAENTIVQCITKHKASVNRLFCSIGKYINKSILAMSEFLGIPVEKLEQMPVGEVQKIYNELKASNDGKYSKVA